MKNLLNYQTSEYDCGPVTLLNGIRYLFDREDIYPDIIKFIMLYSMDTYNEEGELCKHGTSAAAMNFITSWLNHFSQIKNFPLHCEFYSGEEVTLTPESPVIENDRILLFDPYYEEEDDPDLDEEYATDEILFIHDQPKKANRSVAIERLNRTTTDYYEMGKPCCREALVMFNTDLKKS